ncbi:MAG: hypothetical protein AB1640_22590 [bacterium]
MAEVETVRVLQVHQDLVHQRREWIFERIGWLLMGLLILGGLAGLSGPGPLSHATTGDPGSSVWAEYNRFERKQAPAILKVHVATGVASGDTVRLWIDRKFIEKIEIRHMDPEPRAVLAGTDRMTFVIGVTDAGSETLVTCHFEPNEHGPLPARLGLEGARELRFSQFIYP